MHSLKSRITVLAILVIVISVAVVSTLSVVFIRNTERGESNQLLLLMCETGSRNLDYYFTSVENSVRRVSTFAEQDIEGLGEEQLQRHMARMKPYFEEIAHKTNGVLTFYYRIDPEISKTVKGFWFIKLNDDDYYEHEVTDITLYDTADTTKLVWFTVPKFEGKAIWLSPYITDNLGANVISYNVPIYYRGQFVGVIGIEIDYSTMAEQVGAIRLFQNGYAFLNDGEGNLIYHPRIDVAAMTEENQPEIPEGIISDSTFITYTFEGKEKEAAWLKLSNGMRLNVCVPIDETDGEWELLIQEILIASGAVILVLGFLTLLYVRRMVKPLQELTEAARQVDSGNYNIQLDYNRDDEVGRLTQTFKRLISHMKENITDLKKRANVDALTSVRNKGAYAAYIEELQGKLESLNGKMPFAIAVFDCDDLKTINDRYGHDKGDIYLKTSSRLICKVFQHSPVFRTGGDEFAAVLQNDDYRNREELRARFTENAASICRAAANEWEQVHVSMGMAEYDPDTDRSVIETMRRADRNMYADKHRRKEARTNQQK